MVVFEKPSGAVQICLDPKHLNKVIHRPHYHLQTLSDILPELSGARYFTKLDARSGYWTIKLDNDSSYLTTFNTPYGRYRFLRLPFGLKSAQVEFQCKIDYCYAGLRGAVAIVDDVLVNGKTRAEHDYNLKAALQRAGQMGIKLNDEKLEVDSHMLNTLVMCSLQMTSSQNLKRSLLYRSRNLLKIVMNLKQFLVW